MPIQAIIDTVAAQIRSQRVAPRRAELRALVSRLVGDQRRVQEDINAIRSRCLGSPSLAATVLPDLLPDPAGLAAERLLSKMSRGGQADALDRIGLPSPKLLVACGVVALCKPLRDPPNPKSKRAIALCAAILRLAHEQVGDPVSADDARATQWMGSLHKARRAYADENPRPSKPDDVAPAIARSMIDEAIARSRSKGLLYAKALMVRNPEGKESAGYCG
jgi:hypothetical protein